MAKFIQLSSHFWLREDKIEAIDYMESESLDHNFLKVYTSDTIYDFQGERAKEAWKNLQMLMELV